MPKETELNPLPAWVAHPRPVQNPIPNTWTPNWRNDDIVFAVTFL